MLTQEGHKCMMYEKELKHLGESTAHFFGASKHYFEKQAWDFRFLRVVLWSRPECSKFNSCDSVYTDVNNF